jgi:single-stranded-DNA-specific exonuclease
MQSKWKLRSEEQINQKFLEYCHKDSLIARLLYGRGIKDQELAKYFLDNLSVAESNPLEIPEMDKAISRIKTAIEKKEKILIYGDYDVDGTSSVAVLYRTFQAINYRVDYYIPNRHNEGYGLNKEAIQKISTQGIDLLITCDCGISNYQEVAFGNELGLDTIITDHHSIPETPPESIANCNPKTLPVEHPLHYLPGVGVAYKLAELILQKYLDQDFAKEKIKDLQDLLALGMIADLAPLKNENRFLTIQGLERLSKTKKPGLIELMKICGIKNETDSESIGFSLAPRINAAGRLSDAEKAVRLMITEDFTEAKELAENLDSENKSRQELCNEIFQDTLNLIVETPEEYKNVISLASKNWNHGVIGIVASRLVERFHRPVFIMSIENNIVKGSVRSIDYTDLDIYEEMTLLQKNSGIFLKFGGHKMAAGFSLAVENLETFHRLLRKHFAVKFGNQEISKTLKIDAAIKLEELKPEFLSRINLLAPFGIENPYPIFVTKDTNIFSIKLIGKDEKHLKLYLQEDGNPKKYEAVIWNKAEDFLEKYGTGSKLCLAFQPKIKQFNGETFIQMDIKDWKESSEIDSFKSIFSRLISNVKI